MCLALEAKLNIPTHPGYFLSFCIFLKLAISLVLGILAREIRQENETKCTQNGNFMYLKNPKKSDKKMTRTNE